MDRRRIAQIKELSAQMALAWACKQVHTITVTREEIERLHTRKSK